MNLSGRAVREACRDVGIGPESVWVVYDEIDLPLCAHRWRLVGPGPPRAARRTAPEVGLAAADGGRQSLGRKAGPLDARADARTNPLHRRPKALTRGPSPGPRLPGGHCLFPGP